MPAAILATAPFRTRMREVRQFLITLEAIQIYEQLLDDLEHIVYPNLEAFPLIGRLYLEGPVRSTEALMAIARLARDAGARLRQYIHGDFTILYAVAPTTIHLVSIRHHRESTFIP